MNRLLAFLRLAALAGTGLGVVLHALTYVLLASEPDAARSSLDLSCALSGLLFLGLFPVIGLASVLQYRAGSGSYVPDRRTRFRVLEYALVLYLLGAMLHAISVLQARLPPGQANLSLPGDYYESIYSLRTGLTVAIIAYWQVAGMLTSPLQPDSGLTPAGREPAAPARKWTRRRAAIVIFEGALSLVAFFGGLELVRAAVHLPAGIAGIPVPDWLILTLFIGAFFPLWNRALAALWQRFAGETPS